MFSFRIIETRKQTKKNILTKKKPKNKLEKNGNKFKLEKFEQKIKKVDNQFV